MERSFVKALIAASVVAAVTAAVTFPPSLGVRSPEAAPGLPANELPAMDGAVSPIENAANQSLAEAEAAIRRAKFYDEQVEPQIAATDELNRLAADRCVDRLTRLIDRYQTGVRPFVEDLTSISTRLAIVRRMPGDWWNQDDRIHNYIGAKFEQHLFSEQTLTRDIIGILQDFRSDIDANQRHMLVQVRASLSTADLPDAELQSYRPFFQQVAADLQDYSTRQGTTSVSNGLTTILVSEAGSYVAVSLVGGLFGRIAATGAVTAAVGAGATATGSAAGAGGGSVVGPAGTVIGFVVGLGVGLGVDWYLTDQFQSKLSTQMTGYLDKLEQMLLYGAPTNFGDAIGRQEQGETADGGIVAALPIVCDDLRSAYRERFYQQIVKTSTKPQVTK